MCPTFWVGVTKQEVGRWVLAVPVCAPKNTKMGIFRGRVQGPLSRAVFPSPLQHPQLSGAVCKSCAPRSARGQTWSRAAA